MGESNPERALNEVQGKREALWAQREALDTVRQRAGADPSAALAAAIDEAAAETDVLAL